MDAGEAGEGQGVDRRGAEADQEVDLREVEADLVEEAGAEAGVVAGAAVEGKL